MWLNYLSLLIGILASSTFVFTGVSAVDVEGNITWNNLCENIKQLKPTKVVLDGGKWSADVRRDGRFTLRDVEAGSYVLDVLARDHIFDNLRVDVLPLKAVPTDSASSTSSVEASEQVVEVRPLTAGTPHHPLPPAPQPALLPYPIVLHPRKAKVYVVPKADFSIVAMFKGNPMMLMMVGMALMMFVMPKILASMDPEEQKEFFARQDKMMSVQNNVKDMDIGGGLAKLLGGSNEADAAPSGESRVTPVSTPSRSNPAAGSKKAKGKKR